MKECNQQNPHTSSHHNEDLPPGWEMLTDPNSGFPFYANHNNRTTSWIHPRLQTSVPDHQYIHTQPQGTSPLQANSRNSPLVSGHITPTLHEVPVTIRGTSDPYMHRHQRLDQAYNVNPQPLFYPRPSHTVSMDGGTTIPITHLSRSCLPDHTGRTKANHVRFSDVVVENSGTAQHNSDSSRNDLPQAPAGGQRDCPPSGNLENVYRNTADVHRKVPNLHGSVNNIGCEDVHTHRNAGGVFTNNANIHTNVASSHATADKVPVVHVHEKVPNAPTPTGSAHEHFTHISSVAGLNKNPQGNVKVSKPTVHPTDNAGTAPVNVASPQRSESPVVSKQLQEIAKIKAQIDKLQSRVSAFRGLKTDSEHAFLDEMLTRGLLLLDNIDTGGNPEVRSARRKIVAYIQQLFDELELKVFASETQIPRNTCQSSCDESIKQLGGTATVEESVADEEDVKGVVDKADVKGVVGHDGTKGVKEMVLDSEISC